MKACSKCGESKPLSSFYANRKAADGHRGDCKSCVLKSRRERYENDGETLRQRSNSYKSNNPEKIAAWRAANPDKVKTYGRRSLLRAYGLTEDDFAAMLDAQEGKCAICGTSEPGGAANDTWKVDHDHATGHVRGLLCHRCNLGLGYFRDNPESLEAAIAYLANSAAARKVV